MVLRGTLVLVGSGVLALGFVAVLGSYEARVWTLATEKPRKSNKILVGWVALMGLFCGLRISPFLVIVFWPIAAFIYWWDGYIVDRMP